MNAAFRPTPRVLCACTIVLCACTIFGCATFQTGPSLTLPDGEALEIAGRGQLHVIERNPQARETVLLVHGYGAS